MAAGDTNITESISPLSIFIVRIVACTLGLVGVILIIFGLPLPKNALRHLITATALSDLVNICMTFTLLIFPILSQKSEIFNGIQEYFIFLSLVIPVAIIRYEYCLVVKEKMWQEIRVGWTISLCFLGALLISLVNIPYYFHLYEHDNAAYIRYEIIRASFWILFFSICVGMHLLTVTRLKAKRLLIPTRSASILYMERICIALTITNIGCFVPIIILIITHVISLCYPDDDLPKYVILYVGVIAIMSHLIKGLFHALAIMWSKWKYNQDVNTDFVVETLNQDKDDEGQAYLSKDLYKLLSFQISLGASSIGKNE